MKRSKEWWSRLTKDERSQLVRLERAQYCYGAMGGYMADDCSECTCCGAPMMGSGLCNDCEDSFSSLLEKANGGT